MQVTMSSPEGNKENCPRVDNHTTTIHSNNKNNKNHHPAIDESRRKDWKEEEDKMRPTSNGTGNQMPGTSRRRRSRSPTRRNRSRSRSSSSSQSSNSRSRSRKRHCSSSSRHRREQETSRSSYYHSDSHRCRRYERDESCGDPTTGRDRPQQQRQSQSHPHPRWEPPPPRAPHREQYEHDRSRRRRRPPPPPHRPPVAEYRVVDAPHDDKLGHVAADPRGDDPTQRITAKASSRGNGRNTESFDPASTLVRPDLRIQVGSNQTQVLNRPLKHDDVIIVPELFGAEDDWTLYYQLVQELSEVQRQEENTPGGERAEWISWHEGAHLICQNPTGSPTFGKLVDRLCEYFSIRKDSIGTRFNWYRDSSDWKPFHHDSAAFNPQRARNQNITVGVSFGATRELAFIRAEPLQSEDKVRLYFPQTNNGVFSFGRDANILWKHGVNALPPAQQDGKGRISIILWGLAQNAIEEEGSPPLLGSDGKGPHANQNRNQRRNDHHHDRRGRGDGHRNSKDEGRGRRGNHAQVKYR